MPRKKFRREPCDCRDCVTPLYSDEIWQVPGQHFAAMQDPPPKCLVIFGDGALLPAPSGSSDSTIILQDPDEEARAAAGVMSDHPHLDGLARDGCSGLLALQLTSATGELLSNG